MQGASVDEAIASTIQKPAAATRQSAPPAPEGFRTLTENSAHILFPADNEVFYNNAQIFNRDLSVLVARLLLGQKREEAEAKLAKRVQRWEAARDAGKPMTSKHPAEGACTGARILDALSASGLRAIRYAKELEHLSLVLANDIEAPAVESIRRNVAFNGLDPSLVQVRHADAALTMMMHREPASQFDLVDLDPFGSPAQFLDSAVQAVSEGGMLAVTCTDMAVLCGNHSEACFGKYGAMPLRGKHCHEFALRLVLGCLQTHASRYKRYIVPLLSCSIDFYIRIFVRVYTSPQEVKRAASKLSHVYQCVGCGSYALQPVAAVNTRNGRCRAPTAPDNAAVCEHCGGSMRVGGPIWHEPMHDAEFVRRAKLELEPPAQAADRPLASHKKLVGLFDSLSDVRTPYENRPQHLPALSLSLLPPPPRACACACLCLCVQRDALVSPA
jgi:tRNA (guanine26-N2/guanine27-N2)-dimethyltransferase